MSSRGRGDRGRGRGDRGRGGPTRGFAGDRGRGGGGGDARGRGGPRGGGSGGPARGGFGGRGRGGNFGIWQEGVRAVHSPQLKEEEDRVVAKFKAEKDDSPELPLRPGWGTQGQPGVVRANFFTIRLPKDPIYDYKVKITPDPGKGIKERIFQLLERHPKISPFARFIAHDKTERLVSARELEQPLEVTIDHTDEGAPAESARPFQVEVTLRLTLDPDQLTRFCHADLNERKWDFQPFVSALNLIIQKRASTEAIRAGKNRYCFPAEQDRQNNALSPAFFAFKGFYSSARPSLGRVVLNVNVCMTPFYVSGSLLDAISKFQQRTQGALPSKFPEKVKIVTRHLGYAKIHTLSGILAGPRQVFFNCSKYTPPKTSVADYFLREYNIHLNPNLPVVNAGGAKRPTYLPAELCEVIEQPYYGRLTGMETTNMIRRACNPPATNAATIVNDGLRLLGLQNGPLDGFNISVDQEMIAVPIRVLQAPQVSYGARSLTVINATWNVLSVKFKRAARLATWGVIGVLDGGRGVDQQSAQDLATGFWNKLKACGMHVPNSPQILPTKQLPHPNQDPGRRKALDLIEEAIKRLGAPDMIVFLLSNRDDFIYPGIKTLCDTKLGVHSVCMQIDNVRDQKKQDQYFSNVALKVNTKMGGVNHTVDDRALGWLKTTPTMVVGMDVTHPSPHSIPGTPSVAAVVANVDDTFAQFPVSLRVQKGREEMIQELTEMMVERLQAYKAASKDKAFPKRVIVYRDGVSEGQYEKVLKEEFNSQIKESFRKVGGGSTYDPKVTIVICGKRHHSRFYPSTAEQKSNNGNTLPGTVQDRGLSSPFLFDFYLQAHSGLQGHARPTHYVVIYDENHFNADVMQQGTHQFSYQYVRATKAVSLVPPAYYADLACERARCYLSRYFVSKDDNKGKKNRDDEEKVLEEAKKAWRGVHDKLKGTMFYI